MKLNDAPITGSTSIKIQSKFAKFLFVIACGTAGNAMNETQALAAVKATNFELEKVSPDGSISPLRKLSLSDYLEIGSLLSSGPVTVETAGDTTTVTGDIICALDGDIEPNPQDIYTLKVTDLPAYCSADVYLITQKRRASIHFKYDLAKIYSDVPSLVELSSAHLLGIPKTDLVKVELEADGQDRLELLPAELKSLLVDMNAQAFNINGAVTPAGLNLYTFPVPSANRAYLTATQDKTLIVVNAVRV